MITFRAVLTAAVLLTLSACAENASSVTGPDRAAFNTGHTFGGGNRSDSTTTTTATSEEGAAVGFSGHTFGGGN